MTTPQTLRILSLDGGGMRGYLSACWLEKFVQQWGINANELWKHFDVIAGTSVGGIQSCGYANGMSPTELKSFFTEDGPMIFTIRTTLDTTCNPLKPDGGMCTASEASNRPNIPQKIGMLLTKDPFYKTERSPTSIDPLPVCQGVKCTVSNSNYGDLYLTKKLTSIFGDHTLFDLKGNVAITSYNQTTDTPAVFSNAGLPGFVGSSQKIVDVALCTSAAPSYLPSVTLSASPDGTLAGEYIDGGVYQNNPASLALTLGKMMKPAATKICLLSVGTGLGKYTFDDSSSLQGDALRDSFVNPLTLLDIAMTASQEAVAFAMQQQALYSLDTFYYYRFQYKFPPGQDVELDNSTPAFTDMLQSKANESFASDLSNIMTFIGHLDA